MTFGIEHGALTRVMPTTRGNCVGLGAGAHDARSAPLADTELGGSGAISAHGLRISTTPQREIGVQTYDEGGRVASGDPTTTDHAAFKEHAPAPDAPRVLTSSQNRDVLVTVLGTQLRCLVGELKRLQICDFIPDFDARFHRGSAAFRIRKRKQDQLRKALYPRVLPGSRSALCTVVTVLRLKAMTRAQGARVSAECTKGAHPAARCRHCPALFVSDRRVDGVHQRLSRRQVPGAVEASLNLKLFGIDSPWYLHAAGGGISAAVHARVPEPVFLQSGHGSGMVARAYMILLLFETAQALRL